MGSAGVSAHLVKFCFLPHRRPPAGAPTKLIVLRLILSYLYFRPVVTVPNERIVAVVCEIGMQLHSLN